MKLPIPKLNLSGLVGSMTKPVFGVVGLIRAKLPAKLGGKPPDPNAPAPEDPYADIPEHLRPTFFQRNAHVLPIWGAYGVIGTSLAGILTYAVLTGDATREELAAKVPRVTVTEFTVAEPSEPEDIPITEELALSKEADAASQDDTTPQAEDLMASDPNTPPAPSPRSDEVDRYAGNLAPHPDPGLVEEIETIGLLPRIGDDGRLPWKVYARPSSSLETRPRIAVVIANLGLSIRMTEAAIAMPGSVTLAFSPYAPRLEEWVQQARDAGHEVMLGLPMEPSDFPRSDAGLLSLMTTADLDQNVLNFRRVLSETSGYIGVVNQFGSGFTANRAAVQPILKAIGKRGLVYLDTMANAASIAPEEAARLGTSHASADLFIDPNQSRSVVFTRLSQLELVAETKRSAVIVVDPFPVIMDRVHDWIDTLGEKNMVLTPLSGVIAARERDARRQQQGSNG